MKIAVIAGDELKKEFQAKLISQEMEITWVESVNDFSRAGKMDAYFDLDFKMKKERIDMLSRLLPGPVFINSVVHTLDEIGQPFIRINAWPTFLKREITELSIQMAGYPNLAKAVLDAMHWQYQIVPDKIGMVSGRIIAMIINEAYYTVEEHVSSKEDIDIAMKLGTNYPLGPFEWSKKIGLKNILDLLKALQKEDELYTVSAMLEKETLEL